LQYMSFAPSACCLSGSITDKKPRGSVEVVGGVLTYVSKPPGDSKGRAVVIATDVFGQSYANVRALVADKFANAGFTAYVPDLFDGTPAKEEGMEMLAAFMLSKRSPGLFGWISSIFINLWRICYLIYCFVPFMLRHRAHNKKLPILDAVFADLKSRGVSKIGLIGFCYGGFFSLYYGKQKDGPVDAFATAHTQIKVPQDILPLVKPGFFICADRDEFAFPNAARLQAEAILRQRQDTKYEFRFYPGTFHGFAVRGDDKIPEIQKAQDDAINAAAAFFNEQLR